MVPEEKRSEKPFQPCSKPEISFVGNFFSYCCLIFSSIFPGIQVRVYVGLGGELGIKIKQKIGEETGARHIL
jgi:hypothetical protein